MGIQGPLTAQSLGRSPYDEAVDGEGEADPRQPAQMYDRRGRPVNPDTKRINRDLIRSHNEVMVVIGVAEPEYPKEGSEIQSRIRHSEYEETVGRRIDSIGRHCAELVAIFGVAGLRQRILIYKRYSEVPFAQLFFQARKEFSITRDILPGAPLSILTNYIDRTVARAWLNDDTKAGTRAVLHEIWSYFRVHLKLYLSMQRLGLMPGQWYPPASFFVPFTQASPIPPPPPFPGFAPGPLLGWSCGILVSAIPFLSWVTVCRIARDLKPELWREVFRLVPSTAFKGKRLPPPSPALDPTPVPAAPIDEVFVSENLPDSISESQRNPDSQPARRSSIFSTRGDGYETEDDDNDGVSTTFISFEVEATESADAPPGQWSAELQPSHPLDTRPAEERVPVYLDTVLTQLPALFATDIFTNVLLRISMAPYESTALRLLARSHRLRNDMDCDDMYNVDVSEGFNLVSIVNFLGVELIHLVISGELWAVFTCLAQLFHRTEEEWQAEEGKPE